MSRMLASEALRRMVLLESDGYSAAIKGLLNAMGYGNFAWAKIQGSHVTVFLGGQPGQDETHPEAGQRLVDAIGGHITEDGSPVDRWYAWTWEAPIEEIANAQS